MKNYINTKYQTIIISNSRNNGNYKLYDKKVISTLLRTSAS